MASDTEPAAGLTALRDGSQAAFLTNDNAAGIGRQFIEFIGERPVSRLIVISPYWDHDLAALKYLIAQLAGRSGALMNRSAAYFRYGLKRVSGGQAGDIGTLDPARFFHAKAIIAQTAQADHVLFGSANCTTAALGNASFSGINEEACLYRRLPPQAAVQALVLKSFWQTKKKSTA